MTTPGAPVQEITRSAAAISAGSLERSAEVAETVAAIRSACAWLRLATTMLAAPIRAAVATASELIDPAPTTSTLRPVSEPGRDRQAGARDAGHPGAGSSGRRASGRRASGRRASGG